MDYINLQIVDWLPLSISGVLVGNDDGGHTIIINAKLSYEQQRDAYLHETLHIYNRDMDAHLNVDMLERERHERLSNI